MKNKKILTTMKLSAVLVEKCKRTYNTENTSDAIRNALADFLLLPFEEQEIDDFALHNVVPNVEDRKKVRSFPIRIPETLFYIVKALSGGSSVSDTVSMMICQTLYKKTRLMDVSRNNNLLYIWGNKRNEKMQSAIRNIKATAVNVWWNKSVETCAGGLSIYSNIKFADNEILNDSDWLLVNLYKSIKENPCELIIRARALSVNQRTFDQQKKLLNNAVRSSKVDYEAAAGYLYLNLNSYKRKGNALDYLASDKRYQKRLATIRPLCQRMNRQTKTAIYNEDIFKIIEKYRKQKGILFIVDPPYLDADLYNNEGNKFDEKAHERLAKLLQLVKHNSENDFIYFCRITAPKRYQNGTDAESYNIHMRGCIDDLYYGHGFFYIDVVLDVNTTERIITSFNFDGATPYGTRGGQN